MTTYCVLRLVIDRASPLLVSVSSSSLYRHSDPWTHRHSFQMKSIVSSRCLPGEDARSRRFTFWKISGSSRCHTLDRPWEDWKEAETWQRRVTQTSKDTHARNLAQESHKPVSDHNSQKRLRSFFSPGSQASPCIRLPSPSGPVES